MKCNLKTREKLKESGYIRSLGNLMPIHKMGNEKVQLNDSLPDDMIEYGKSAVRTDSAFFKLLVEKLK